MKSAIEWEWDTDNDVDVTRYCEELDTHARERINEMTGQGFTSGELYYETYDPETDTELSFYGSWRCGH